MKVALFQMDIKWESAPQNLDKVEKWVSELDADIELVVLPEMFATGFSMQPEKVAQPMEGEIVTRLVSLAHRSDKAIVASVAIAEDGEYYNRLFFIRPDKEYHYYDKRHLFRMGGEDKKYASGTERLIIEYRGLRIMPLICYDLRFPVWSRNRNDYDLLIYVANWPGVRRYAWQTLLRARAIENQCYCIGVNRSGNDPKNSYTGDSVVLDYLGQPIIECNPGQEEMIQVELSIEQLEEFRRGFPAALDSDRFEIL